MGETVESMINVLETKVMVLKDKIEGNNIRLDGSLEQFKNLKDKDEKERFINLLEYMKIDVEHYINKMKEEK